MVSTFDFKTAKQNIEEINTIVATCPEPLRQRCFELLFEEVFKGAKRNAPEKSDRDEEADKGKPGHEKQPEKIQDLQKKLPPNVLAFTRRQNITTAELEKLFLIDHDPLLPVYKINTSKMATAQLQKVMMILLENGLLNNSLSAPYPELRDSIREDGLMDGNFNKMLKRNHDLFKGAITQAAIKEDQTVELTGAGLERLGQIIKELAGS